MWKFALEDGLLDAPGPLPPSASSFGRTGLHSGPRTEVATEFVSPHIFATWSGGELSSSTHYITLAGNIALLTAKTYVYTESRSMAVLAALIDSAIDLFTQGLLLLANRASRANGHNEAYPAGRSRLEPVAVVCCALFMGLGAVQVIREAATELVAFALHGAVRLFMLRPLDVGLILSTVLLKFGLYCWCTFVHRRTHNVTISALALDNRNDVLSNIAALLAASATQVRASWWICDPIGALLISLYIVSTWTLTGIEHVEMLIGKRADPQFVEVVRELTETHDPSISLDVLRAYHFGQKYLVELEIVMPHDTVLSESHDVAVRLQHKIEALDAVERCFVHVDYQPRTVDEHDPTASLRDKTGRPAAQQLTPQPPVQTGDLSELNDAERTFGPSGERAAAKVPTRPTAR